MRPKTLAEVASLSAAGDSFDLCLGNFLDGFYAAPCGKALAEEPPLLAPLDDALGRVRDAYLAATAEELARRLELRQARWTVGEARQLRRPWFATPMASLRAVLILESPAGFRSRNS